MTAGLVTVEVAEDDLKFCFNDVIGVTKFDGDGHGLSRCMKAVDFIVEEADRYFFIEVKDPSTPLAANPNAVRDLEISVASEKLCRTLAVKFRDTFIYRWAEEKPSKPIHYVSLVTLEQALLTRLNDQVNGFLPIKNLPAGWNRVFAASCHVLSIDSWNRNFTKWPVTRISSTTP